MRVSIDVGYDGNRPITGYFVDCYSTNGGVTRQTETVSSTVTVTGLTANRTYRCSASARNELGYSYSSAPTETFLSSRQLTVTAISGSGVVSDSSGVLNCSTACVAPLAPDAAATITATPADGWVFSSWGGACAGTSRICSVMMNQDREVTVTFTLAPPAVASTNNNSGSASSPATTAAPSTPSTPTVTNLVLKAGKVTAKFAAERGTTYAITASSGNVTKTGTCIVASATATCSLKVSSGSWSITITPLRGSAKGKPFRKVVKVKKASAKSLRSR